MKKAIIASLALAAAASAYGQGQIKVDNLIGAAIIPIQTDSGILGAGSAQVYRYDATAAGGIGSAIGGVAPITANGRFKLADASAVDGVLPGQTVGLIVRAWDGGADYASATTKGTSPNWTSKPLGGVDAGGNLVITPKLDGFTSFKVAGSATAGPVTAGPATAGPVTAGANTTPGGTSTVVPEPSTIALGILGAAALVLRRRK